MVSPLHTVMISTLLWSMAADAAPPPTPLTIGSPSPKLAAMKYVKGDAVKSLSAGTIHVIEFSGTGCAPCIELIPHINALQLKHADIVFISVYGEKENVVRRFLMDKGKNIAVRVAVDPTGAMWRDWHEAAIQGGIPCCFVVGKEGKIAWIGDPTELAVPLARIVDGSFDPQEDSLRLMVEQGAAIRLQRTREGEEKAQEEDNRIRRDLYAQGKPHLGNLPMHWLRPIRCWPRSMTAPKRLRGSGYHACFCLPSCRQNGRKHISSQPSWRLKQRPQANGWKCTTRP